MASLLRKIARDFIIFCFQIASRLMRQRSLLKGAEHLRNLPSPVIFSLTHDSYYEIPSLFKVYTSVKPSPDLVFLAKDDFMSGRYLSTNFGKNSRILKSLLLLLDRTRLPEAVFRVLRLTTIHRPFMENYRIARNHVKKEIGDQLNKVRDGVMRGLTTIVFPEGTTWGFGGLKKIRSSVYQLVENTYASYKKKAYVLPINVKVDRLLKGRKDIFINIGKPVFFRESKEEFNRRLQEMMKRLHTITFSQVAACYLKYLAREAQQRQTRLELAVDSMTESLDAIVKKISLLVKSKALPNIDLNLLDREYLKKKVEKFVGYCGKKGYLVSAGIREQARALYVNHELILASYDARAFRKLNPLGFHANELESLGEEIIQRVYSGIAGKSAGRATRG
ncbi:MAG TPA: hypothetical protein ENN21_08440 [Spirochaetes bacterium]|nr:hypothetical protein [Spirochaetota bacterium]